MPKFRWNERVGKFECQVRRKTLRDLTEEELTKKVLIYMDEEGLGLPDDLPGTTKNEMHILFHKDIVPYVELAILARNKNIPIELLAKLIANYREAS